MTSLSHRLSQWAYSPILFNIRCTNNVRENCSVRLPSAFSRVHVVSSLTKFGRITGCTPGGIGHYLAKEFKSQGLRVFATARKVESITDLANEGIETLSLEVSDPNSINALKEEVHSRTNGRLDILVNNAGRNYTVPGLEVELDEIKTTFEANLFGVMLMCQAFAPMLIEAKGTIVQIGSLAGKTLPSLHLLV